MCSLFSLHNSVKTELGRKNSRKLHATRDVTSAAPPQIVSPNLVVNIPILHWKARKQAIERHVQIENFFIFLMRYKLIYKLSKYSTKEILKTTLN